MSDYPTRALAIGGPNHGEYIPTFDNNVVEVAADDWKPAWEVEDGPIRPPSYSRGRYALQRLAVGHLEDQQWVWVLLWKGWGA